MIVHVLVHILAYIQMNCMLHMDIFTPQPAIHMCIIDYERDSTISERVLWFATALTISSEHRFRSCRADGDFHTGDFSLADRGGTKLWQCIAIGGDTIMDTLPALP